MQLRRGASTILAGIALCSAGCVDSQQGYKEFSEIEPPALEKVAASDSMTSVDVSVDPAIASNDQKTAPQSVTDANSGRTAESVESHDSVLEDAESAAPSASEVSRDVTSVAEMKSETASAEPPGIPDPTNAATIGVPEVRGTTLVVSKQSGLQGPADTPAIENTALSEPRKIELLVPEKRLRKERGSNAVRVTYDDIDLLKVLNMEPVPVDAVDHFPEWLSSLNGKPIRIRGFMYPTYEPTGLTEFALARDNGICCFVRQPKIYDIISVVLSDGVTTDYIEGRPFDVEGIFHIDPKADETDLSRLYRIDNARVLR